MPELPEVETVVRSLLPKLKGLEISEARLLFRPILREKRLLSIDKLKGRKILGLRRRGKMMLIDCEGDLSLLFHFKMTGQLLFYPREEPLDRHTHFILSFKGKNIELRFRDVRKFGFISLVRASEALFQDELKGLGPEPLEIDFARFRRLFAGRKGRLKSLLLNQNFIAGIGNIYADEILFQAKIHPLTSASCLGEDDLRQLWRAMRNVLRKALSHKGSSIRDFRDAEGRRGQFQNFHLVYGRESLACYTCGGRVSRIRLGGRSTFFCPGCQEPFSGVKEKA
jgi:formamidopyrimidine-DNA glycosylase